MTSLYSLSTQPGYEHDFMELGEGLPFLSVQSDRIERTERLEKGHGLRKFFATAVIETRHERSYDDSYSGEGTSTWAYQAARPAAAPFRRRCAPEGLCSGLLDSPVAAVSRS